MKGNKPMYRASINGHITYQKIWPKRQKLDGPVYKYTQNEMAGIHVWKNN